MRRALFVFCIAALLQISCGQTPALWGTYATPTLDLRPFILLPADTATPTLAPSLTPAPTATFTPTPTLMPVESATAQAFVSGTPATPNVETTTTPTLDVAAYLYYAQSGDTVASLAVRFGVDPSEIRSDAALPQEGLIAPGTLLVIPDRIAADTSPNVQIIPDSELVFSATATNFDIADYITAANGNLNHYREYLGSTGWNDGPDEITRLATENSINPRLLLAILDYESRWVHGAPVDSLHIEYPMGYQNFLYRGLFSQMVWAVNQLSIGYYGWRTGTLTELKFPDGSSLRLDPRLNAGTVAIQYLFSRLHNRSQWAQMIEPNSGFPTFYTELFGDPWARADSVEPLFPPGIKLPDLVLPFQPKIEWSYSGGPHGAWEHDGSLAAIDFAPATDHGGCDPTPTWVTAAAPGLIVRSDHGVVVEDLDGDGYEQTGWNLVYLHIATVGRVPVGTFVQANDHIGHASCEGGIATGTHLHLIRKYNGEWVAADGPLPFVLSGWTVHNGAAPYAGTLTKGSQTIIADPVGQFKSVIIRSSNDP